MEVARRARLSWSTLAKVETNKKIPEPKSLMALFIALELSPEEERRVLELWLHARFGKYYRLAGN